MKRSMIGLVSGLVVAGFLGLASQALAGDAKLECSITKNGKTYTRMVKTAAECSKLGGKLVNPSDEDKTK